MEERYTFANSAAGLEHALQTTLSLRAAGFKTRLVTRVLCRFTVHTVVATPRRRATRRERGCSL
jgi:hypothetical protein